MFGFSYNPQDNKLGVGFFMALAGGAFFILNSAINVINLIVYFLWRRAASSTTPSLDETDSTSKSVPDIENGTEKSNTTKNGKTLTTHRDDKKR